MRAPLIGSFAHDDPDYRRALVSASTRLTHRDRKAEQGAQSVAAAAAFGIRTGPAFDGVAALTAALEEVEEPTMRARLDEARRSLATPTSRLVEGWGLGDGVTGYIVDTVPAVLHCWARHAGNAEPAIQEMICCGGDTDTTAAIVGGLAVATKGVQSLPSDWIEGIVEWPRSVSWMMRLGEALATSTAPPRYWAVGTLPRNLVFLALVYAQIARRMLPPY